MVMDLYSMLYDILYSVGILHLFVGVIINGYDCSNMTDNFASSELQLRSDLLLGRMGAYF